MATLLRRNCKQVGKNGCSRFPSGAIDSHARIINRATKQILENEQEATAELLKAIDDLHRLVDKHKDQLLGEIKGNTKSAVSDLVNPLLPPANCQSRQKVFFMSLARVELTLQNGFHVVRGTHALDLCVEVLAKVLAMMTDRELRICSRVSSKFRSAVAQVRQQLPVVVEGPNAATKIITVRGVTTHACGAGRFETPEFSVYFGTTDVPVSMSLIFKWSEAGDMTFLVRPRTELACDAVLKFTFMSAAEDEVLGIVRVRVPCAAVNACVAEQQEWGHEAGVKHADLLKMLCNDVLHVYLLCRYV
eukprot:TRINITY_DN3485_c0_g1_i1.p1 TRINITY_DN3485_c0_g1~~TRINITY_DN3485_c0_g1_i1.p1  ORF type:complete len:304 (+),score=94.20 TRINITY_DN3485_c0_g1_i1:185-1096(+)